MRSTREDGCRILAAALVLGAATALAAPAVAARHHAPSRPDLVISKGAVGASGTALSGSVVVRNRGRAARASAASLTIRVHAQRVVLKRLAVPALRRSESRTLKIAAVVPAGLPAGSRTLRVCADSRSRIRERSESNNCRSVGTLVIPAGKPVPPPDPDPKPTTPPPKTTPSSVPAHPVAFTAGVPFTLASPTPYWIDVPSAYDATHATPTTLFVWLHGCGGFGSGDIYAVAPAADRPYIAVAVGGREGSCWDPGGDQATVLAAIADVKTHFNINPRRVILGGYSSGGDLAYRTAFYDAKAFAGILVENTSPFRDTGSGQTASLAAAAWKFHIVHLAHLQDTTYPIAGVRAETGAVQDAGFPITRIERDGTHYDDAGAIVNGGAVPGTNADLVTYLLPHLGDDWLAPAA